MSVPRPKSRALSLTPVPLQSVTHKVKHLEQILEHKRCSKVSADELIEL